MVVEHGQRVAALCGLHGEVALEVHLPQGIGLFAFEALKGLALGGLLGTDEPVAPQDLRDRAGHGDPGVAQVGQAPLQLAATPSGMLLPQGPRIASSMASGVRLGLPWGQRLRSSIPVRAGRTSDA